MRLINSVGFRTFVTGIIFAGALAAAPFAVVNGQQDSPAVAAASTSDALSWQQRLDRARALAAAHNLNLAVTELVAIRAGANDRSITDLARVMLMSIYLEQSDQAKYSQLLDEAFTARSAQDEASNRIYFALAGKVVKGTRERMDRYREFGLNFTDRNLPADAENDLNRLRLSLEKVINQAKNIVDDNPRGTDALALLEDASMVRCTLARGEDERSRWHNECMIAREGLANSESRVATLSSSSNSGQAQTSGTWNQPVIDPDLARDAVASNTSSVRPAPTVVKTAIVRSVNDPATTINAGSLLDKAARKVAPSYPSAAKAARVTGVVRVEIVVDENGKVVEAKSNIGPALLRSAAIDAAKRWTFKPSTVDGQAVRMSGYLNFNFTD
jgi:TonB family protein